MHSYLIFLVSLDDIIYTTSFSQNELTIEDMINFFCKLLKNETIV